MSLRRTLFLFLIAATVALMLRACVVEGIYIATASMERTLHVGTHFWLDKMTFRFRAPRRGEIVILRSPVPPHNEMAKRVVAVAGDTVELREKKLYLNGEPQEESYGLREQTYQHTQAERQDSCRR